MEALVLVVLLAWLFRKWGVTRLGWGWFVLLSLLGSLAFATRSRSCSPAGSGRGVATAGGKRPPRA